MTLPHIENVLYHIVSHNKFFFKVIEDKKISVKK
jgi:hypothetical protein